jgi:histidinol-phosphate aminotransferase
MLKSIIHLVRENIRNLSAYSSARSLYQSGILLDANESPFESELNSPLGMHLNRYPDGSNKELREYMGTLFQLPAENIALGNGSDEIIDLLIRIFCQPLVDKILILPPTFGMYRVAANMNQVGIVEILNQPDILLEDRILPLSLPVAEILEKSRDSVKIIFICNPNNPTGSTFNQNDILKIVSESGCIVVVDEAYSDFMDDPSLVSSLAQYSNLVILKTFSKAFAMAGIRLGMALSSEEIINLIQKVKLPYNINTLSSRTILENRDRLEFVNQNVKRILENKTMLETELKKLRGVRAVIPSQSNFFLVRFKQSDKVFSELVKKGFIVRKVDSKYGMENCLRISVGNEMENQGLIDALNRMDQEME